MSKHDIGEYIKEEGKEIWVKEFDLKDLERELREKRNHKLTEEVAARVKKEKAALKREDPAKYEQQKVDMVQETEARNEALRREKEARYKTLQP